MTSFHPTCRHCNRDFDAHTRTCYGNFCPGADLSEVDFDGPLADYPDRFESAFPQWVSAYEVGQSYGGPQEGGWWRDSYEPLESTRVDSQSERDTMLGKLRGRYDLDTEGEYIHSNDPEHPDFDRERARGRTSCAGGHDIAVFAEFSFAAASVNPEGGYE